MREESTYLAIRTSQGGRTVYTTRIPLADLSVILTIPDPAKPDPDNRKVDISHAKGFGQYLADNPGWVAPALLIRDTGGCRFEPISEDGSVGYLTVPWPIGGIGRLITIDGQHRILGVHLEKKRRTWLFRHGVEGLSTRGASGPDRSSGHIRRLLARALPVGTASC
ncbi:hypothetical protein SMICM304S_09207 [Streptomyces microflavus]